MEILLESIQTQIDAEAEHIIETLTANPPEVILVHGLEMVEVVDQWHPDISGCYSILAAVELISTIQSSNRFYRPTVIFAIGDLKAYPVTYAYAYAAEFTRQWESGSRKGKEPILISDNDWNLGKMALAVETRSELRFLRLYLRRHALHPGNAITMSAAWHIPRIQMISSELGLEGLGLVSREAVLQSLGLRDTDSEPESIEYIKAALRKERLKMLFMLCIGDRGGVIFEFLSRYLGGLKTMTTSLRSNEMQLL